jgi:hypothetical protein
MINLRDRESMGTNALALGSILVLACTLVFMMVVPKPTNQGLAKERRDREFRVKLDTQNARERVQASQAAITPLVWSVPISQIGPGALEKVTDLVESRRLTLIALRPQRSQQVADLTQVPFLATVEGPFPAALGFVRDLEGASNRMAVSLIQMASQDGDSDRVTLTVGLQTYADPPAVSGESSSEVAQRG